MEKKTSRHRSDDLAEAKTGLVRERLLDSACRLFYAEGVRAVGIQRLLGDAQVAKASLYAHFDSKDDLVAAYLERRGGDWRRKIERELTASGADAKGRLMLVFDMLSELIGSPDYRGCPLQNACSELTDEKHPARLVVNRQREWFRNLIRGLVRELGAPEGEQLERTLILLHDGALAAALADHDPEAGKQARWAVERILHDF